MDEFPKRGFYLVQSTSYQDRQSFGRFGAAGLEDILIVDRLSPLFVGDSTEQQASNDPAFWHLERPRRDVCTVQQLNRLWPVSSRWRSLASIQAASSPGLYGAVRQL